MKNFILFLLFMSTSLYAQGLGGGINLGGGGGDMAKAVYDTDDNGQPDTADDSDALGGTAAASYATDAEVAAAYVPLTGTTTLSGNFIPTFDGSVSLGSSSKLFTNVYSYNFFVGEALDAVLHAGSELDADLITSGTLDAGRLPSQAMQFPAGWTSGDILYHNGTGLARLPKGTDGQYLSLSSGFPAWDTLATVSAGTGDQGTAIYNINRTGSGTHGNHTVVLQSSFHGSFLSVPGNYCAILSGDQNKLNHGSASYSIIAGGQSGYISGAIAHGTISGGVNNTITASQAVIGGGSGNSVSGTAGTVSGGASNTAVAYAAVVGGSSVSAVGTYSVAGGLSTYAGGSYSVALGRRARAVNTGSFVFGDRTDADVSSDRLDHVKFRANGGFTISMANGDITIWGKYPTASLPTANATGDLVFDTTAGIYKFWDGSAWSAL